jgi:DNA repair exonuclease SbcCD ATPase subunit
MSEQIAAGTCACGAFGQLFRTGKCAHCYIDELESRSSERANALEELDRRVGALRLKYRADPNETLEQFVERLASKSHEGELFEAFVRSQQIALGLDRAYAVKMVEHFVREYRQEHAPSSAIEAPDHENIADMLKSWPASERCPLCGQHGQHDHTPAEIVIYRNGVKYGRSIK